MKKRKQFNREQKMCLSAHYLKVNDWLLEEETDFYLKIVNKRTGQKMFIDKFIRRINK